MRKNGFISSMMTEAPMNRTWYALRIAYLGSLLAVFLVPYLIRDRLSGSWILWGLFGAAILSLVITYSKTIYYAVKSG